MEWTKVKDSSDIKLYEREVRNTDLEEYIAVTSIDAKMEVIGEVLRDVPQYSKWIPDCSSARIVKKYNRNTFVIYMVLKPPIISDRDIVLKNETVYDYKNGCALISFSCTNEVKIPSENEYTRITVMKGIFELEYLGRNKTKIMYKLKVDPAGYVPKVIAYSVMKDYPFSTLKRLKKMITDSKYSAAAKGSEEERQINARTASKTDVKKILSNYMMKLVKHKDVLKTIIAAETDNIKNIESSGSTYASIEKAVIDIYLKYINKIITDKNAASRLKNNKHLIAEIIDLYTTACEANYTSVDSIVASYNS
jgi:hypothetical protein